MRTPLTPHPHRHITGLLTPVLGSHLLTPPCSGCCDNQLNPPFIPASVWCPQCDGEVEIDEFFALCCPVCGTPTADLRSGREFEIAWVDFEDPKDEEP
ncbi:hydrogenase/urease maturation nickel metallochaperone HypA [Corynebacterium diphtheriae]|uniref:hydrogenase/urease maturation nickel metallochaperone HypA n=1 Tax=Corynebacterium diphtheriae TaxID=1717 RepID=UPI003FCE4E37